MPSRSLTNLSIQNFNHSPFGSLLPGRQANSGDYKYGFNGKENDNEVKGTGNQQDYGFRIYDPRLGKFLSVDPLTKDYPWYTPYQFAGNKPIQAVDLDGKEEFLVIHWMDGNSLRGVTIIRLHNSQKIIKNSTAIVYKSLPHEQRKKYIVTETKQEKYKEHTSFPQQFLNNDKHVSFLDPKISTWEENFRKEEASFIKEGGPNYDKKFETNNMVNFEKPEWQVDIFLPNPSNVTFETNSSVLTQSGVNELKKLLFYLELFPDATMQIQGHTDNIGGRDANQKLSENRANSVRDYLISNGVQPERLSTKGFGDTMPKTDNKTEKGREMNRRVEFVPE
mgnify:CR=1 FL=1